MLTMVNDADTGQVTAPVMCAVAEKLGDRGIEVGWPKYGDSRRLTIANARGARSDITAEDCGFVTWDYWPHTGPATDPDDLAAIVRDVLGAPAATRGPATRGTLPLKGAAGRILRANGLKVTLAAYQDDVALDVITEIVVTNPAIPSCGLVRVTDDACVTWECHHDAPPAECALAVADTVVPILNHDPRRKSGRSLAAAAGPEKIIPASAGRKVWTARKSRPILSQWPIREQQRQSNWARPSGPAWR
jgi:hypothetical protein